MVEGCVLEKNLLIAEEFVNGLKRNTQDLDHVFFMAKDLLQTSRNVLNPVAEVFSVFGKALSKNKDINRSYGRWLTKRGHAKGIDKGR